MQAMRLNRPIFLYLLLLICSFLLHSCQADSNKALIDGLEITPVSNNYHDTSNRYVEVITEMTKDGSICWSEGFTGKKSFQWIRYEWLSKNASDKQLLELMNNPNAHMRAYAFLGLKDRPDINLKSIVLEHLNDSSSFSCINGCFGEEKRVNSFCLEECSALFSRKELSQYRNMISKGSDIYISIPKK